MDPLSDSNIISFVIVALLLVMSAFFSSAETAVTSINRLKIKTMAEEGDQKAEYLLGLIKDMSNFLGTILIGNNIVNLTISALVTTMTIKIIGDHGVGYATVILTVFILIFGEVLPKTIATTNPETTSLRYVGILRLLTFLFSPLVVILNFITKLILKIFGIDATPKHGYVTENEIKTIVNVSHEEGAIHEQEKDYIENVFDLKTGYVRDVMVPKVDMACIDINSGLDEVMEIFKSEQYTRYPIYQGEKDNIVGIINIKDLLLYDSINDSEKFNIKDIMRQPYYTFELKKTNELMVEIIEDTEHLRTSMAIVLDEYGVAVGIITLEDMLEELVGEIRDEYDEHEIDMIQNVKEDVFLIEGSMKLDDINEQLDLEDKGLGLYSDDYDSIGGLLIQELGAFPEEGDYTITDSGVKIIAQELDGKRIEKIKLDFSEAINALNPEETEES